MKNLILLFSLILSFSSCSQNEEEKINDNSIVGTWKLIEKIESGNDGLPIWKPVSDTQSYTYTFYEKGLITNSRYNCNGTYVFNSSNSLHIDFECNDGKINGDFNFKFTNKNLVLTPNPNTCDEGCDEKFKKIEE